MLVTTALVIGAVGLFGRADFQTPDGSAEARAPFVFWTLLLAVWAALNAVFLGTDLFNLYVALELLTFGAVPLVCLDGRAETIAAALRYLLFALAGSVLYLLGVALLYGAYGTLDIGLLSARVRARAGHVGCCRSDDGRIAGQDSALPVAPVAAARPCRCARRGQRRALGARGQGILFPDRQDLVRRHARSARRCCNADARRDWAPRQLCSAACSRCGRRG